jgi:COMPASS component SWD3
MLKSSQYIKIAEYVAIIAASISIIVAIATKKIILAVVFVLVALVINLINRTSFHRSRQSSSLSVRIKYLEAEITELKEQVALISRQLTSTPTPTKEDPYFPSWQLAKPQSSPRSQQSLPSPSQKKPPVWKYTQTLREHTNLVSSVAISPDGKLLASASWDRTLRLWSLSTGNLIDYLNAHEQGLLTLTFARLNSEGTTQINLATGGFDQTIKLWKIEDIEENNPRITSIDRFTGHIGSVRSLVVTPDGKNIISGSYDRTIKQWSLESKEILRNWNEESGAINAIALSSDGQILASGSSSGQITLWELEKGKLICQITSNLSSVESLAISPYSQTIAAGCVDGTIKFWETIDLRSGKEPTLDKIISAHSGEVTSLIFSRDESILISGSVDGTIKIWHSDSTKLLSLLQKTTDSQEQTSAGVVSLALSPDEEFIVAAKVDGTIDIWQQTKNKQ